MNAQAIEHGTITVQRIIPAKGPGKSAAIKDVDGMLFGVWPDKLGLVRDGETYEIEFTSTVKQGVTYRDIKTIRAATPAAASPSQFTAPRQSTPSAAAQPEAKQAGSNQPYYRPTSPRDAERMFVCSTLNAFIQTGRVECHRQMLTEYVNELRLVWQQTFGKEDGG
jgi:hypothetical protein